MRSWQRFRRLSSREKAWFLQALGLLPVTVVALRLVSLRRWQSLLSRFLPRGLNPAVDFASAEAASRMTNAAARRCFPQPNCLSRSVVLWWLLQRQGIPGELRFGSVREKGQFEAHAWVELEGRVLDQSDAEFHRFTPLNRPAMSPEAKPR